MKQREAWKVIGASACPTMKQQMFGPTGRFAEEGPINREDCGVLQTQCRLLTLSLDEEHGKIIFNFGTNVSWIGLRSAEARQIAASLLRHAETIEKRMLP